MKIGDLVDCANVSIDRSFEIGLVVGFNKKGEGGKGFVHVFILGQIHILQDFNLRDINENS